MISLIKRASDNEILTRFGDVTNVEVKSSCTDKDLVTDADKKSSEFILSRIRKLNYAYRCNIVHFMC